MTYDEGGPAQQWEKEFPIRRLGQVDKTMGRKEEKLDPYLTPCTKANPREIVSLDIKGETIYL